MAGFDAAFSARLGDPLARAVQIAGALGSVLGSTVRYAWRARAVRPSGHQDLTYSPAEERFPERARRPAEGVGGPPRLGSFTAPGTRRCTGPASTAAAVRG